MTPFANSPHFRQITLRPGALFFADGPGVVHTLLGSCVAITVWHPQRRVGGACHYLLAHREHYHKNDHHSPGYYASDAIRYFVDQGRRIGVRPEDFEVKLFGGGNMFEGFHNRAHTIDVASANIKQGLQLLHRHGFRVKTTDVGGVRYRKIFFELSSGDVWVQYGRSLKTALLEGEA